MTDSRPYISDRTHAAPDRPEILEERNRLLMKLKWPIFTMGFLAVFLGAIQASLQGRFLFAAVYLGLYGIVCMAFILDRQIPFPVRAWVLVGGLYLASVTVLMRIGLSGIGVEIVMLVCLLSAVFWGVRTALVIVGVSIVVITCVAFCLISGILPIHEKDMLNSTSALAWATSGTFFAMMAVGFVFIPQMFLDRLKESLSLLEDKTRNLEESNLSLRREMAAREEAEEAAKEAHTIINRSPVVAFLWKNVKGWPIEFASNNVKRLFGYEADEFTSGKITYARIVHPDDLEKVMVEVATYAEGKGRPEFHHTPYRILTKDGGIKWIEDMTFIRRNDKGEITHFEGIVWDITERVEAEEEKSVLQAKLQRSQTMESLGLLAGGVAHDLNNILSGVVSYPDLLLMDMPEDNTLRKPLETIQESGQRAVAIVQDLLTVARGVATTKQPLNLNDVVNNYLHSPEHAKLKQFHPAVTVISNLDSNLLNIEGSPAHIKKIVMNLIWNASEAIDGAGTVTIATENRYVDKPLRGYSYVIEGEYTVLSVSDDGAGISADDIERIFEPFYTKKVMGRSGTGLGLAVTWNVIRDHGGYIDVKSDRNGTSFEVYLPITRIDVSDESISAPPDDYTGHGEAILVVDDVETQREMSCKMLDKLGYKVNAMSSGEDAVEYLKEHTADLILLDMIMDPGINGRETYERILAIHPRQKAIIVSGFAATDEVKATLQLGAGQYIKKPFKLQQIGQAVKEELKK